jgi:hypothetical protein
MRGVAAAVALALMVVACGSTVAVGPGPSPSPLPRSGEVPTPGSEGASPSAVEVAAPAGPKPGTLDPRCSQRPAPGDAGAGTAGTLTKAVRIRGWLHTDCTWILDSMGRQVRLLSIGLRGMQSGTGELKPETHSKDQCGGGWVHPDPARADNVAAWGFNSVRLGLSWSNLEPTPPTTDASGALIHHWNEPYLAALDQIVAQFKARGIAVILAMMQAYWSPVFKDITTYFGSMCQGLGMPVWLYPDAAHLTVAQAEIEFFANKDHIQDGLAAAWTFLAKRYAKEPTVVGLDMLNEPVTHREFDVELLHLDEFYDRIGTAIHAVNPNALLFFQDNNDDYGHAHFSLTRAPRVPNVVYTYHLYAYDWAPLGRKVNQDFWDRAEEWGVPLWNGEFPAFSGSAPRIVNKAWQADLATYFDFAREHGIGWSVQTYAPNWFLNDAGTAPKPGLLEAIRQGF